MELEQQQDISDANTNMYGPPNRCEVLDLLSWVQCFGVYTAVVSNSCPQKVQQLHRYLTTIVRDARRCGGKSWLLYDQMFPQQAEVGTTNWSKLTNSLLCHIPTTAECEGEDVCTLYGVGPRSKQLLTSTPVTKSPTHTVTLRSSSCPLDYYFWE